MPDRTTQNNNMTANVAILAFMGPFRLVPFPEHVGQKVLKYKEM